MNEEMTTIQDECILMGAPRIIKKNGGYLANIIKRVAENYDSSDFDCVAFLADIQLAKDNCTSIVEAAELTIKTLDKLKNEVISK
jgi:hypothetical protein